MTNNNVLEDAHKDDIMKMLDNKENVEYIAKSIDYDKIVENDYNLSVSSYVEAKDNREVINIVELNKDISKTVAKIDALRVDIDAIVADLEGGTL